MHGIAINISNDLAAFKYINPCGFESSIMTSLSKILNKQIDSELFSKECKIYYLKYFI
jgi:lipoyl(octanoyl) transferase